METAIEIAAKGRGNIHQQSKNEPEGAHAGRRDKRADQPMAADNRHLIRTTYPTTIRLPWLKFLS